MTAKTYAILNYGCQMNESDAEHYAGQLQELGYKAAEDFHDADVVVVNTCCVRESAEKRILGKIGELKGVKANHPGQIVCVAGCMAQKDGEKLIKKHPQIDLLIGTAHVNGFKEILSEYLSEKGERVYNSLEVKESEFEGERIRQSGFSAWIPIMYGCNNFCTYCIVPYVRGRERSRSIENIVDEVRQAVVKGYKEFTLLGQNVNSYGKDFGVKDQFAKLLRRVNEIPGVERIRYMTSHPRDMHEDVIKAVAECEHICENFHIPFQSGSNKILKAMNRGYTREKYLELVAMIRRYVPEAAITTDIIVGFPGETEEQHQELVDFVDEMEFDRLGVFTYSPEEDTPAAEMEGQIPEEVKEDRQAEIMELQQEIAFEQAEDMVGKEVLVMIEGKVADENAYVGRTYKDAPNVDGLIFVNTEEELMSGDFARVKVTGAAEYDLIGELIS